MATDIAVFLSEVIRRPTQIAAIAPSSAGTARLITRGLENTRGPVVEIGPGTGVFTRAILARGVDPSRLTLLEMNPGFCEHLREKFPGVTVLNRTAQDIADLGLRDISAVISGVPLLARPQLQRAIVTPAFKVLASDGIMTQLAYSRKSPLSCAMQSELGVTSRHRGTIWANLPPARIFEYTRNGQ
jgi:phosphatidylethanolamine/phosphatidyl-N-methylethanolamine N-methyltransferase